MDADAQTIMLVLALVLVFSLLYFAGLLRKVLQELRTHEDQLERQLDRMERATVVVADNLAASIGRADAADDNVPGSSADAALRTGNGN